MIKTELEPLLRASLEKTLEMMFFTMPDEVSANAERPDGNLIVVRLGFQGRPTGTLGLLVSERLAQSLAANFTGCDEDSALPPEKVTAVIGELANMVCGAVLSQIKSSESFDLESPNPTLVPAGEAVPEFAGSERCACRFEFVEGAMTAFFLIQERA
jgi:CheY-specific phosphatase CheX